MGKDRRYVLERLDILMPNPGTYLYIRAYAHICAQTGCGGFGKSEYDSQCHNTFLRHKWQYRSYCKRLHM